MLIYPTIDLDNGEARPPAASRGGGANDDAPAPTAGELAAQMAGQGFAWLHVIDRDARDHGRPANTGIITGILDYMDLPVLLDAGTADSDVIDDWLERGVSRLVLSPALTHNPGRIETLAARHPDQLVAVLDIDAGAAADTLSMLQDSPLAGVLVREATSAYSAKAAALGDLAMKLGMHCAYDGVFPDFRSFCRMLADDNHGFDGLFTGAMYNASDFDAYTALRMVARSEALTR